MTRWECRWSNICAAYSDERVCGHGFEGPKVVSYHPRYERDRPECYLEHVYFCAKFWSKYKPRVRRVLARIVARALGMTTAELEPQLDLALATAIAHHDLGKLVKEYQQRDRGCKRHEIVTAPIIYDVLKETCGEFGEGVAAIASSAVYLHHEAIQVGWWRELRSPALDYLSSFLYGKSFEMIGVSSTVIDAVNATISNLGLELNVGKLVARRAKRLVNSEDILRGLGRIISFVDGSPMAPRLRLAIAGVLLPLRIVDDEAARYGRRWST